MPEESAPEPTPAPETIQPTPSPATEEPSLAPEPIAEEPIAEEPAAAAVEDPFKIVATTEARQVSAMSIAGLGAVLEVLTESGASHVFIPGAEVYTDEATGMAVVLKRRV